MERGALHDGRPLNEVIADILGKDWNPHNDSHAQTIYYIAGAILQTIANLATRRHGEMRLALNTLKNTAKVSKLRAKELLLPSGRVEQREKVELAYATPEFYKFLIKIESVYHELLKEKNVAVFGVGLVGDIGHVLEHFIDETGFSCLLPNTGADVKASVYRALLSSYSNTRGKDFGYKTNARAPPNTEQTLRAKLAIASITAKRKKEKLREYSKEPSAKPSAKPESSTLTPVEGIWAAVKYTEGTYTGKIVKVAEGSKEGTYKITVRWGSNDPDDIFDYPDPEEGIVLSENEDGIAAADDESFFCAVSDEELTNAMTSIENNFVDEE